VEVLRADAALSYGLGELVGRAPQMRALFETIEKVAPADVAVHIYGESGTGKELVARAVHSRSKRADGPFVKVNCGSLTEPYSNRNCFGHEKGAFTGAISAGWAASN